MLCANDRGDNSRWTDLEDFVCDRGSNVPLKARRLLRLCRVVAPRAAIFTNARSAATTASTKGMSQEPSTD